MILPIVSALFLEHRPAAAAGNGDLALASRDPKLLAAVGTLEIEMLLVPVHGPAQPKPFDHGVHSVHEFCVLQSAAGEIS